MAGETLYADVRRSLLHSSLKSGPTVPVGAPLAVVTFPCIRPIAIVGTSRRRMKRGIGLRPPPGGSAPRQPPAYTYDGAIHP